MMSDTDDTDTLLLIPPKFTVPTESDGEFDTSVVEDLIDHVERLESRVHNIENNTSFLGSRSGERSHGGENGIVLSESRQSSDQTQQTVFPAGTQFNNEVGTSRLDEDLLSEVDRYLESVNIAGMDTSFEAGSERDSGGERVLNAVSSSSKHLALPDVDKLLKEMEATQSEIETKLRARENEYGLGEFNLLNSKAPSVVDERNKFDRQRETRGDTNLKNDFITNRRAYVLGDYSRDFYRRTPTSTREESRGSTVDEALARRDVYLVGSSHNGDDPSRISGGLSRSPVRTSPKKNPSSFEARRLFSPRRRIPFPDGLQSKLRDSSSAAPSSAVDSYSDRNGQFGGSGDGNEFPSDRLKHDKSAPNPLTGLIGGNLLSLAELWKNDSDSIGINDPSKLKRKLEEEKVRRMHLEDAVQTLNKKVLEEQEKLAVALVVDEGKDKAIIQVTTAWRQMVEHWKKIEADRHAMSQKLITEKTVLKKAREDVDKKVERWEKEVSQALDLAAGFKGKCEFLEAELSVNKEVMEGKVTDLEEKLNVKERTLTDLLEERKLLLEKLRSREEEVEERSHLVSLAQREVEVVQDSLSKAEAELAVVKEQRELIDLRLKEEKSRVAVLEQHKRTLEGQLDKAEGSQMKSEEIAKAAAAELDSCKTDLRNLYQNQLETVVRSKLAEFQSQLDAAQLSMQAEIDSTREMAQRKAEEQHSSLVNSHVVEIRRLEAIHKDELRSMEFKLMDSERRRVKLENNHKEIAQKLHGVMENQWQQALGILTSELSTRQPNSDPKVGKSDLKPVSSQHRTHKLSERESESSDETPFNKEDLVTCRSSKPGQSGKQEQLLKYIQMLLEKPPGKAVESSTSMLDTSLSGLDIHSDQWLHQPAKVTGTGVTNAAYDPANQNRKPPWK